MIAGVIIAAGASSRLGRPKQLLPLAGRPLLAHALANALASRLDEVVLVLGHQAPTIERALVKALGPTRTSIVVNPRYAEGQSTSVVAGLDATPSGAEAVLFLLGDQPGVAPAIIDAVLATYRSSPAPIVAPTYGGTIGNPILFARHLFPVLKCLSGDEGARGVVRRHLGEVRRVEIGLAAPPPDVDTEADYQSLLAAWDD